ncbi:MAG: hypothetical protein J6P60_00660 [Lachnospiraceae bacterium]|nr:hypothetical protein [Lachnospiraceae bacterium]
MDETNLIIDLAELLYSKGWISCQEKNRLYLLLSERERSRRNREGVQQEEKENGMN